MAHEMMSVADYIAYAANARVIYVELYETAMALVPPTVSEPVNIECHYTARDLSQKYPRTVSTIRNELKWLERWGWITNRRGNVRYLGRRIAGVPHLLADLAARNATGENHLVSREILGLKFTDAPDISADSVKRGAMREWRGNQTTGGGAFVDLDS